MQSNRTNTASQILRLRPKHQQEGGWKRCLEVVLDQDDVELRHQQPIRQKQTSQCGKSLCRASASRHGLTLLVVRMQGGKIGDCRQGCRDSGRLAGSVWGRPSRTWDFLVDLDCQRTARNDKQDTRDGEMLGRHREFSPSAWSQTFLW